MVLPGNSRWTDADMPLTVGFVRHTPKMSKREQEQAFMDAANVSLIKAR